MASLIHEKSPIEEQDTTKFEPSKSDSLSHSERDKPGNSDDVSIDATWTESTDVPRRRMGLIQVVSLMVNQMIGSGVFSTPGVVLLLTGSKSMSLVLWALGGVYTFLR
jgi:hypothetical protein